MLTTAQFNPRLRRAWGRVQIQRRSISLHPDLERAPANRTKEVLCHEFAHLAAVQLFGPDIQPHGREWAALVSKAGFRPTLFLPPERLDSAQPKAKPAVRVEHRCPVCQMTRMARRAVPSWRCASCVANGLEGHLVIRRPTSPEPHE
jgi:predicted SprT family Zn-dependent metalloprotease